MKLLDQIELDSSAVFFTEEFGHSLTWAGGSIWCLPDDNWLAVDGEYSDTSTHQVTVTIHQADAPDLAVGDTVTLDSVDYVVRDMQKDTGRTGDVLLVLSI